jgi:hypothetical protein
MAAQERRKMMDERIIRGVATKVIIPYGEPPFASFVRRTGQIKKPRRA